MKLGHGVAMAIVGAALLSGWGECYIVKWLGWVLSLSCSSLILCKRKLHKKEILDYFNRMYYKMKSKLYGVLLKWIAK